MAIARRNKPYIDVMENVFGGLRISTDNQPRARGDIEPDLRPRPWLAGVSMSTVHVSITDDEEDGVHG